MRRLFPFTVLLCFLISCQSSGAVQKRTLKLNLFTEPTSLDPRLAEGMAGNTTVLELFEGLTRINAEGNPSLALAKKIDISPDGCHYTFFLRPSKWSNGEPCTADDFVFSWKQALSPHFPSEFAYLMFDIKGAREAKTGLDTPEKIGVYAEGPYILHVELTHPAPYFLNLLTNAMFFPVSQRTVLDNPQWSDKAGSDFVGNGPFKLISWEHNSQVVVEKNPYYWDANSVSIEKIHHAIIDSSTTEITMFEQGELDWAGGPMSMLPYDALPTLRERFGVNLFSVDAVYWYYLNTSDPLLKNKKIRQALSYSIKRDELSSNLAKGAHAPATGILPPSIISNQINFLKNRDEEEVQNLFNEGLAELGLSRDKIGSLKIATNLSEDHLKLAQALQERWHDLFGLSVSIESAEWKVHLTKLQQGSYQVGRLGWYANYRDGIDFLNRFRYPSCPKAATGWDQKSFATFADQLDWCIDEATRETLISEAEEILMEEMPVIPLFFLNFNYIKKPHLEGVVFSPFGRVDFRWAFWNDSD